MAVAFAILWMVFAIPAHAFTGTDGNFYAAPWEEQYYRDKDASDRRAIDKMQNDMEQQNVQRENDMKMQKLQNEIDELEAR